MDIIEKTILFFRENGKPGERFALTVDRLGFENVENEILNGDILSRKEEILKANMDKLTSVATVLLEKE